MQVYTGQVVAIKKIRIGKPKEGVNFTALREIKLLKELKDPNMIELIDVYHHKGSLHLVFEFMETDLEAVIRDRDIFLSPADIKSYLQMRPCHLPQEMGVALVKLADFGLTRIFGSPERRFIHQVFARWYRSPELLFGTKQYGHAVDIWAAGCIFAEILLRRPFLQGQIDIDQLGKIFAAFGTPTTAQWQDMFLPDYVEYKYVSAPPLRYVFPTASDDTLDLLAKMFVYDPKNRINVQQALDHRYFTSAPFPTVPEKLPRPATKKESKASGLEGPTVLSPPRKSRSVMPEPGGFEGNAHRNDQANEVRPGYVSRSGPTTLDFSVFDACSPTSGRDTF